MPRLIVAVFFLICFVPEYRTVDYLGGRIFQKTLLFNSDFISSFSLMDLILCSIFLVSIVLKRKESEEITVKMPIETKKYFQISLLVIVLSTVNSISNGNLNPLFFLKPFSYIVIVYFTIQNLKLTRFEIESLTRFFTVFIFLYCSAVASWMLIGQNFSLGQLYFVPWSVLLLFLASMLTKITKSRGILVDYLTAILLLVIIFVGQIRSIWISLIVILFGIFSLKEKSYSKNDSRVKSNFYLSRKIQSAFIFAGVLLVVNLRENFVYRRILAMNIFGEISPDAIGYQDNADHLSDFQAGISAIRANWLFGSGLGAGWETPASSYRQIAFGFHNSLSTVWFWTGILGAILWILFPFLFVKLLLKLKSGLHQSSMTSFFEADSLKIWIFAIYLPSLAFQAWSFTSQSFGIFFGLLLGLLVHRHRVK